MATQVLPIANTKVSAEFTLSVPTLVGQQHLGAQHFRVDREGPDPGGTARTPAWPAGVGHWPVSGHRRPAQPQRQGVEGEGRTRHPRRLGAVCGCVGGLGGASMIVLAGMGLLLIGSAVWHEIQALRGKR